VIVWFSSSKCHLVLRGELKFRRVLSVRFGGAPYRIWVTDNYFRFSFRVMLTHYFCETQRPPPPWTAECFVIRLSAPENNALMPPAQLSPALAHPAPLVSSWKRSNLLARVSNDICHSSTWFVFGKAEQSIKQAVIRRQCHGFSSFDLEFSEMVKVKWPSINFLL